MEVRRYKEGRGGQEVVAGLSALSLPPYLASGWDLCPASGMLLSPSVQFISIRIDLEAWRSGHVTSNEVM